jgi:hypothetical protein
VRVGLRCCGDVREIYISSVVVVVAGAGMGVEGKGN